MNRPYKQYRLIPYFYTLAWETIQTGHPLIRPLFWSDPEDARLWGVEDAFLLSDALLVCPVLEEGMREAKLSRRESLRVILPKGGWCNYWHDGLIEGANEITLDAPLEQIPLLVRAGSILPMEEGKQFILHLYPPVRGQGYIHPFQRVRLNTLLGKMTELI